MRLLHVSALLFAAACSSTTAVPSVPVPTSSAPAASSSEAPAPAPAEKRMAEPAPPKPSGPFAALPPSLSTSPTSDVKPVKRSGKTWPYHAWDRAESVVMNWAPYGPTSEMHAYGERGWTTRIAYRATLDAEIAKRSVDLAVKEGGELDVTKCPIPRHAVVLFEGDTPVASINVDLTCQNVLLWPQWTAKETASMAPKLAAEFIPRWRKVFIEELHLPEWTEKE